jgi:hypothetical protein
VAIHGLLVFIDGRIDSDKAACEKFHGHDGQRRRRNANNPSHPTNTKPRLLLLWQLAQPLGESAGFERFESGGVTSLPQLSST